MSLSLYLYLSLSIYIYIYTSLSLSIYIYIHMSTSPDGHLFAIAGSTVTGAINADIITMIIIIME